MYNCLVPFFNVFKDLFVSDKNYAKNWFLVHLKNQMENFHKFYRKVSQ